MKNDPNATFTRKELLEEDKFQFKKTLLYMIRIYRKRKSKLLPEITIKIIELAEREDLSII